MSNIKIGEIVKGEITGVTPYGVFVSLEDDYTGLVHISEVSDKYVKNLTKIFNIGDIINVKVVGIDKVKNHAKLSIKKIDYKVEQSLSMIPESGTGFGMLRDKLGEWTEEKYSEIKKNQENWQKRKKKCWHWLLKMIYL